jgi:hypothetical protein
MTVISQVKLYQQGEGPVNTVGAFFGDRTLIKMSLEGLNILRGEAPNKRVYNWNGELSPVVHQLDRHMYVFMFVFIVLS